MIEKNIEKNNCNIERKGSYDLENIRYLSRAHKVIFSSIEQLIRTNRINGFEADAYFVVFYINFSLPYNLQNEGHDFQADFNLLLTTSENILDSSFFKRSVPYLLKKIHHILKNKQPMEIDEAENRCLRFKNLINKKMDIQDAEIKNNDFDKADKPKIVDSLSCKNQFEEIIKDLLFRIHADSYQDGYYNFLPSITDMSFTHSLQEIMECINSKIYKKYTVQDARCFEVFSRSNYYLYKVYKEEPYSYIASIVLTLYGSDDIYPVIKYGDEDPLIQEVVKNINLKDIIQNVSRQLSSNTSLFVSNQSFLSQYILNAVEDNCRDNLKELLEKIKKINNNAKEHKVNDELFLYKHHLKIIQIVNIMGNEGIKYFSALLGNSVLTLQRELERLPLFFIEKELSEFFNALKPEKNIHDFIKDFNDCLRLMNLLCNWDNFSFNFEKNLQLILEIFQKIIEVKFLSYENKASPKEIQKSLTDYIGDITLKGNTDKSNPIKVIIKFLSQAILRKLTGNNQEEPIDHEKVIMLFQKITTDELTKLCLATQCISNNEYKSIYTKLLLADLFEGNIDDILHNIEQDDESCQKLALHNASIRKILLEKNFNPENLLIYPKELNITFTPKNDSNEFDEKLKAYTVLYSYLETLKNKINNRQDNKETLISIENRITRLLKIENNVKKMNKATSIVRAISKYKLKTSGELQDLNEFMEHAIEQANIIGNIKSKTVPKKNNSEKTFIVKQWDKRDKDTFFLGDEVGCCLATTNTQFHAMVQRRMDDAMLFHVAVDKPTGKAAALIWLYLAINDKNEVILVANFFEVAAKYGIEQDLRIALLNGLLKFTDEYCKDNNVKFYMNQLGYGWNKEDLHHYDLVELNILDKLGGPLILDTEAKNLKGKYLTKEKYYLSSLAITKFHKFVHEKINLNNILIGTPKREESKNTKDLLLNNVQQTNENLKQENKKNKVKVKCDKYDVNNILNDTITTKPYSQDKKNIVTKTLKSNPNERITTEQTIDKFSEITESELKKEGTINTINKSDNKEITQLAAAVEVGVEAVIGAVGLFKQHAAKKEDSTCTAEVKL